MIRQQLNYRFGDIRVCLRFGFAFTSVHTQVRFHVIFAHERLLAVLAAVRLDAQVALHVRAATRHHDVSNDYRTVTNTIHVTRVTHFNCH